MNNFAVYEIECDTCYNKLVKIQVSQIKSYISKIKVLCPHCSQTTFVHKFENKIFLSPANGLIMIDVSANPVYDGNEVVSMDTKIVLSKRN